jgi:hypothetical protein
MFESPSKLSSFSLIRVWFCSGLFWGGFNCLFRFTFDGLGFFFSGDFF